MPVGLCNSPNDLQMMMPKVIHGLVVVICMIYMDDMLAYTRRKRLQILPVAIRATCKKVDIFPLKRILEKKSYIP